MVYGFNIVPNGLNIRDGEKAVNPGGLFSCFLKKQSGFVDYLA